MEIDLNCDLGEGCPHDAELMPLITSANIACGYHAGSLTLAHATIRLAVRYGVQVGAHPGYADRENFGRVELQRTEQQVWEDCVYQIGAMMGLANSEGVQLKYLKPHGALYNQACRSNRYAAPVVMAAVQYRLAVMGLPGSRLEALCRGSCPFVPEGFVDRRYLPDGSLVPRSEPNAMMEDPAEAVLQAEWLITEKGVRTLCVHGDNPQAVELVRDLRDSLERLGVRIQAFA
jgi:5-oxoprolinase (ATP-hydrolysing) subunit A